MRRLLTFFAVAAATATAVLYWLHDGDLAAAVEPVVAEWDADLLVQEAGLGHLEAPAAPEPSERP
jgi:hypothetical protein